MKIDGITFPKGADRKLCELLVRLLGPKPVRGKLSSPVCRFLIDGNRGPGIYKGRIGPTGTPMALWFVGTYMNPNQPHPQSLSIWLSVRAIQYVEIKVEGTTIPAWKQDAGVEYEDLMEQISVLRGLSNMAAALS